MLLLFLVGAGAVVPVRGHPGRPAIEDRARRRRREQDETLVEDVTLLEDEDLAMILAAQIPNRIA